MCVVIPQQLDDVYLKETFRERLGKKFKLAIIGMPRSTIVKVANLAKEIEEKMPTPRRNRRSQPLLDSEYLNEELANDEQKKEIKKNCKE